MSSVCGNQQQKDASSSGSTQLSTSSATSGNNSSMKTGEEKSSSLGKRPRGSRAGTKRRLDAGPKLRQLIRYDRDSLLQLRDSRLSSAWPRALDKAFIGESGLWDPVKLFEGEKKSMPEGKTKIERVRNVRIAQPYNNPPGAEDSSFGRTSRRRKRTKEEPPLVSGPQKQRGWPPSTTSAGASGGGNAADEASRSKSESEKEKENKRNMQQQQPSQVQLQRPRVAQPDEVGPRGGAVGAPTLPPRLGSVAAGGGATIFSRHPVLDRRGINPAATGVWERSQGPREQHQYTPSQPQRYRSDGTGYGGEEEELPAWFDEGPLDKLEKLELTGLPEDMEASSEESATQPQPPLMPQYQAAAATTAEPALRREQQPSVTSSSRFAKWLAAEPPADVREASDTSAGQEGGAQQQLERIFQGMRGRRQQHTYHHQDSAAPPATGPSLMHLLRPTSPPPAYTAPDRPLHAQEVEASLKSMLFGGPAAASAASATAAAASAHQAGAAAHNGVSAAAMPNLPPSAHARTLEEIESSLGAADRGGPRAGGAGSQDSRAIYKLIGELQVQMHDAAAGTGTFRDRQNHVPSLVTAGRQSQQPKPPQPPHQQLPHTGQSFSQQQTPRGQAAPPPQGYPVHYSSTAAAAAAAAAAQRRYPVPLQAQQLQQLQAMLLSNLQMQAQMMHNGQMTANSAKTHPLSKLLPQNNALHGTRLLNQNFNQPGVAGAPGTDFAAAGFDVAAAMGSGEMGSAASAAAVAAAFRRPPPSTAAAGGRSSQQLQQQQSAMPQPAMPIVPPMLLSSKPPTSTSSAAAAAAAAATAAQQGWGGAHHHNQQISAMLWNATKLAASVKSGGSQPLSAVAAAWTPSQPVQPSSAAVVANPVDEMPSA